MCGIPRLYRLSMRTMKEGHLFDGIGHPRFGCVLLIKENAFPPSLRGIRYYCFPAPPPTAAPEAGIIYFARGRSGILFTMKSDSTIRSQPNKSGPMRVELSILDSMAAPECQ